ncbi:MAG: diaminopimelate decarboxylase, partial [Spirochaetota bacterium]
TGGDREAVPQVLAGNLCESGDVFTRDEEGIVDRILPRFIVGDVAAIGCAGAYGFSMASRYCSRPLPAEVLVSGGGARLIRRRESIQELFDVAG